MMNILSIVWIVLHINNVIYANHIINENDRVLLMGDSHVENLDYVINKLAKNSNVEFKSVYVIGSTIHQWSNPVTNGWDLSNKWDEIYDFKPSIVLVSLGSNDSYSGECKQEYLDAFLYKLEEIESEYQIVWIGPPNLVRAKFGEEKCYSMFSNSGLNYLDSRKIVIDMEPDKLHTNGKGRKIWGNWIWSQLTGK